MPAHVGFNSCISARAQYFGREKRRQMKNSFFFISVVGALFLRAFGMDSSEFSKIEPHLAPLYLDYYSSQKLSISYRQTADDENKVSYYSKLFNVPMDIAVKKYPSAKYDLLVELGLYGNSVFWKYSPYSDPSDYKAILCEGGRNIFYDNKEKRAVIDYLNYDTESSVPKIYDYLCRVPDFWQDLPRLWKTYKDVIRDALEGRGAVKTLSISDTEMVLEISVPFQRNLPYFIVIHLRRFGSAFMPVKYFHKSSQDGSAISLWKIDCEYGPICMGRVFPKKIVVNYYSYLNDGQRCNVKTEVFSDIRAGWIVPDEAGKFRPLILPRGTVLTKGGKRQERVDMEGVEDKNLE